MGDGTFVSRVVARTSSESRDRHVDGPLRAHPVWRTVPLPSAFAQPAAFDFRTGIPDASLFPSTRWRRLIVRTLRTHVSGDAVYGDPAGHPALRDAIARHVGISRGVMASPTM